MCNFQVKMCNFFDVSRLDADLNPHSRNMTGIFWEKKFIPVQIRVFRTFWSASPLSPRVKIITRGSLKFISCRKTKKQNHFVHFKCRYSYHEVHPTVMSHVTNHATWISITYFKIWRKTNYKIVNSQYRYLLDIEY